MVGISKTLTFIHLFNFNAIHLKFLNKNNNIIIITHHSKKCMFFCFPDFVIFGGKMSSQSSHQILFLV